MPAGFYRLLSQCHCSFEEKEKLLPFIDKLCSYSEQARKEGLKSLEKRLQEIENPYLKYAMGLCIDSILEEETYREVLLKWILMADVKGYELLEHLIIMEAVESIKQGENVRLMRNKLVSILGEEMLEKVEEQ